MQRLATLEEELVSSARLIAGETEGIEKENEGWGSEIEEEFERQELEDRRETEESRIRIRKTRNSLKREPTREEMERHNETHVPFQHWCEQCVMGKAQGNPHRRGGDEECNRPVVSIDYSYAKEEKRNTAKGREGEELEEKGQESEDRKLEDMPVLNVTDKKSGYRFAHVVPEKGVNAHAIECVGEDLDTLGYTELTMKCGQEPSSKRLREIIIRERDMRIYPWKNRQ